MLTFVHISDTHLTSDGTDFHGVDPAALLRRFVAYVNAFPQQPDFVLHTGDIANEGNADAYALAAEALSDLQVPLYLVNGNHDERTLLRKFFDAPQDPSGDPGAPLDYAFEVKGERFLVLDAHTDAVPQPLGQFSETQLARIRAEATSDGPPLTVLLHYLPFKFGSPWLDANMIVTNGLAFHEALLPARDRLRGVFFGHLHHSLQIVRDGILYVCAPSLSGGYLWRPWDDAPVHDPDFPPSYSVVQYQGDQMLVHQYALPGGER